MFKGLNDNTLIIRAAHNMLKNILHYMFLLDSKVTLRGVWPYFISSPGPRSSLSILEDCTEVTSTSPLRVI